ncbi:hypothetical protein BES08_05675 [Novosphingobium resinovorum]|uniref:Uncharacterized protein n=2 Tax=Novosphingobium resinovorum TaxID=158500 RepID=A0A1D8A2G8_9SPHN|nr:hypothetical protein BES08_05675 [Novosphingobium resinovorum]
MDVHVSAGDFESAVNEARRNGFSVDYVSVSAEVSLDEALEEASVDQLRSALSREVPGYTPDQLTAIEACFASVLAGDLADASAFLPRIFEHTAQIDAAERAIHASYFRSVAA